MIEYVLLSVAGALFCLGLAELLHFLKMNFIYPGSSPKTFYIVWLDGDDSVRRINYAGEQSRWLGSRYAEQKIAVYGNISAEEIKICRELAKKYDMIYCPADLLEQTVHNLTKRQ